MRTDTKELRAALRACSGAVSSRPGIPALTGVLLEAEPGRIRATATDLETAVRLEVSATVETDGETWTVLVPLKMLSEAARAWQGETFTLQPDGASSLRVNGAGSLRLLVLEDFPTIGTELGELVATIPAAEYLEAVRAVAPACSRDEARPVLTGILLEVASGSISWTSTDSYRLHHHETHGAGVAELRAIVPGRILERTAKMIGRKATGTVQLRHGPDDYAVDVVLPNGTEVRTRVIEGEYPNWRGLAPEPADVRHSGDYGALEVNDELRTIIDQAGPYCRGTCPVRLELNGAVTVSASAPDLGAFSAVAPVAWTGGDLRVAFSPVYLTGALEATHNGTLYLRDGLKPGVSVSADGRTVALIMPVRLPTPVEAPPEPVAESPAPIAGPGPIHEPSAAEREAGEPVKVDEPEPVTPERFDPDDDGLMACPRCGKRLDFVTWRNHHCEDPGWRGEPGAVEPEAVEPELLPCGCPAELVKDEGHQLGCPLRDPEPVEPEDVERLAEVSAEVEADVREAVSTAADARADRSELRERMPEPEPAAEPEVSSAWAELVHIGDAGRIRVRVIGGPNGLPMVDVRRWVETRRYSGPSRKGIAVPLEVVEVLAGLMIDAAAAADEIVKEGAER